MGNLPAHRCRARLRCAQDDAVATQARPGLLHRSDRGVPHAAAVYLRVPGEHGITCSMRHQGNCLRQRLRRELLRHVERIAHPRPALRNTRSRQTRRLRMDRSVLQSAT